MQSPEHSLAQGGDDLGRALRFGLSKWSGALVIVRRGPWRARRLLRSSHCFARLVKRQWKTRGGVQNHADEEPADALHVAAKGGPPLSAWPAGWRQQMRPEAAAILRSAHDPDLIPTSTSNADGTISLDICVTCTLSMGAPPGQESKHWPACASMQPKSGVGSWRCLALEKFSSVELMDGPWQTEPHARQRCVENIEVDAEDHPDRDPQNGR